MANIKLLYSLMLDYMYHSLLQSALKIILTQYNITVKQQRLLWRPYNYYTSCIAKQVFDIFIFFSEVMPHIISLYYHYQTVIICLNQIDTQPAAVLAELQK